MNRPLSARGTRGASLIEALVAVTLFSIGAAGLAATSVGSTRSNAVSKTASAAAALVHDKIEQLRSLDPGTNPADLAPGVHVDPLNPLTPTGDPNGKYQRQWTVTANTPGVGLSRVVVSVTWNSPIQRSVRGVTLICSTRECS